MSNSQELQDKQRNSTGSRPLFLDPDPNDPDVIFDEVRMTRWDKASQKWRALKAKRDALPPDHPPHKIAMLDRQIDLAREAIKRAEGDVSRRQESIDEWRAGAGHEEYKKSRRTVRDIPNDDLSRLTAEQKEQRAKDQRSDANWRKRCEKKGWTKEMIS